MKTKQKAITPIVATILLVVVSVVLLTIVLNWGRDFSNKSLATVNTEKLSKSNASEFVYTKAFSDGVIQFNYAPPANLKDQDIIITGYKIFFDNNETTEISFTSNHTLSQGLNIIPLTSFSDQNITSRKMDIQLQTSDGKYITLNSVTNNEPYVAEPYVPQQYTAGPLSPGTMADDSAIGTEAWSNVDNSKTSDNIYSGAFIVLLDFYDFGYTTHYLKATNFGFNIPIGATINGIKVEVEEYGSGPLDSSIAKIVKSNGSIGTTSIFDYNSPSSDMNIIFGDSNNLWGETWTAEQINDSNFGVAIYIIGHTSGQCLNENSLISTDNGYIKIKDLQIGDDVVSYNDTTKQLELKPITSVWSNPISIANNRYFYIYYNNGEVIKATENHRFYVSGEYKRADELLIGDLLLSQDFQNYAIENIEIIENTTDKVWDIEVEDNHNFFANDILVHNPLPAPSPEEFYAYVDHVRMTVYYTN
ncbi:MAG TPA: Hint domain-containing protein [archaeon]|nr:Hint domain-containing protein [archaeon]